VAASSAPQASSRAPARPRAAGSLPLPRLITYTSTNCTKLPLPPVLRHSRPGPLSPARAARSPSAGLARPVGADRKSPPLEGHPRKSPPLEGHPRGIEPWRPGALIPRGRRGSGSPMEDRSPPLGGGGVAERAPCAAAVRPAGSGAGGGAGAGAAGAEEEGGEGQARAELDLAMEQLDLEGHRAPGLPVLSPMPLRPDAVTASLGFVSPRG
jgi:hypothetical protein